MNKREKEMRTVYEMIHLYCRKIIKKKNCVQNVWLCMNTQECVLKNVRSWKQRRFARNAKCIVTRRIKGNRFERSCAFQGLEC